MVYHKAIDIISYCLVAGYKLSDEKFSPSCNFWRGYKEDKVAQSFRSGRLRFYQSAVLETDTCMEKGIYSRVEGHLTMRCIFSRHPGTMRSKTRVRPSG